MSTKVISEIAYDNLVQALALNMSDLEAARSRLKNSMGGFSEKLAIKREIADLIATRQRLVQES